MKQETTMPNVIEDDDRSVSTLSNSSSDEGFAPNNKRRYDLHSSSSMKKRKVSHHRRYGNEDVVEQLRSAMVRVLEKRLGTLKTNPSPQTLSTLESLLFTTAVSLEEYADMKTLDERLKRLQMSLLRRRLRQIEA